MIKVTVLYGHPADSSAFEDYYANTHIPIAAKMTGVIKIEFTKFVSGPDGSKPAFYRMAELYFEDMETLQKAMASPEGVATSRDIGNFATGGATMLVGAVL